jgi:hypothetical protein
MSKLSGRGDALRFGVKVAAKHLSQFLGVLANGLTEAVTEALGRPVPLRCVEQ